VKELLQVALLSQKGRATIVSLNICYKSFKITQAH